MYLHHNADSQSIDIAIADFGITIYGSYVAAQKHLDKLGDSDAEALNLAQNGYSVKNLPDTENRGYGISSNMRMVVEGLGGEFAVLSGNALLLYSKDTKKILSLPPEIDFKGTMLIVRFPDQIPNNFNLYNPTKKFKIILFPLKNSSSNWHKCLLSYICNKKEAATFLMQSS